MLLIAVWSARSSSSLIYRTNVLERVEGMISKVQVEEPHLTKKLMGRQSFSLRTYWKNFKIHHLLFLFYVLVKIYRLVSIEDANTYLALYNLESLHNYKIAFRLQGNCIIIPAHWGEHFENNRDWNLNLHLRAGTVLKPVHASLLSVMIPVWRGYHSHFIPLRIVAERKRWSRRS